MTDIYSKAVMTVIAVALTVASSWAQSALDGVDYCPELMRSEEKPDGIRDCNAGCMEEDEFELDNALNVLKQIRADLMSEEQPYVFGGWDRNLHHHYQLKVIQGAMLRRDVIRAQEQADPSADEIARGDYCGFLENRAYYPD